MSEQTGLTVVKRFSYRGNAAEEFSNTYWLTEAPPADATAWRTLFDALVVAEKTCYHSGVEVIRGYGYNDNTGHRYGDTGTVAPSVWSVDLTVAPNSVVPGTATWAAGDTTASGDQAGWVRWKTDRRTDPGGKAIYLRKYFHGVLLQDLPNQDSIKTSLVTAYNALGAKMSDGSFAGGRTVTAAGHTDTLLSHGASVYVTTRTLKRRGKRPGS